MPGRLWLSTALSHPTRARGARKHKVEKQEEEQA